VNNTVVNDRPAGGRFLFVRTGTDSARIVNNVFSGRGDLLSAPGDLQNNIRLAGTAFVDPTGFDYRLKLGTAAIGRGIDPGSAYGIALHPTAQYVHKAKMRTRTRSARLDLGAFEYRSESGR
jgi:hypothetical protein